jgi:mannan endo-1,4-beta-mannosidase
VKLLRIAIMGAAIIAAMVGIVVAGRHDESVAAKPAAPATPHPVTLPATPGTYLGVYVAGVPGSYARVTEFQKISGVRPDVILYYSGGLEPFSRAFASKTAKNGAVPLIQIEPKGINLTAIASGKYDAYLSSYAEAVHAYKGPIILSFGHEMNGTWYSWGNKHTSPATFVAAWRHVVNLFRLAGAANVTWLWTVNIIDNATGIPAPGPWWPGSSYVTWVGIDGYYSTPTTTFAPLFGPTIVAVRALTDRPILIAETGAANGANQANQIGDLFSGVRIYGLLGLMWFDAIGKQDWRLSNPASLSAFHQGGEAYPRLVP